MATFSTGSSFATWARSSPRIIDCAIEPARRRAYIRSGLGSESAGATLRILSSKRRAPTSRASPSRARVAKGERLRDASTRRLAPARRRIGERERAHGERRGSHT